MARLSNSKNSAAKRGTTPAKASDKRKAQVVSLAAEKKKRASAADDLAEMLRRASEADDEGADTDVDTSDDGELTVDDDAEFSNDENATDENEDDMPSENTRKPNRNAKPARGGKNPKAETAKPKGKPAPEKATTKKGKPENLVVEFVRSRETKNKWQYVETVDGEAVENPFKDGMIGSIYISKDALDGKAAPKSITITVEF